MERTPLCTFLKLIHLAAELLQNTCIVSSISMFCLFNVWPLFLHPITCYFGLWSECLLKISKLSGNNHILKKNIYLESVYPVKEQVWTLNKELSVPQCSELKIPQFVFCQKKILLTPSLLVKPVLYTLVYVTLVFLRLNLRTVLHRNVIWMEKKIFALQNSTVVWSSWSS